MSALQGSRTVLPREKRIFWLSMLLITAHWIAAAIIALFGLSSYIIVAILGLLFSGSNLWGYFKCSREAQVLPLRRTLRNALTAPGPSKGVGPCGLAA